MSNVIDQDEFQTVQGKDPDGVDPSDYQEVTVTEDVPSGRVFLDTKARTPQSSDNTGSPVCSPKLRGDLSASTTVNLTTGYQTIYRYPISGSGSGKLKRVMLGFDRNNVDVRLSVDGSVVWEINPSSLLRIQTNTFDDLIPELGLWWDNVENKMAFTLPMEFTDNVTIEAKYFGATAVRKLTHGVFLTKES